MTTGRKRKSIAFTIGGIALVIAGFVLLKFFPADEGVMECCRITSWASAAEHLAGALASFCGRGRCGEIRSWRSSWRWSARMSGAIFIANAAKARAYDVTELSVRGADHLLRA